MRISRSLSLLRNCEDLLISYWSPDKHRSSVQLRRLRARELSESGGIFYVHFMQHIVLLEQVIQRCPADAQSFGRLSLSPLKLSDYFENMVESQLID